MEPKLFIKKLEARRTLKISELAPFDLTWNQWAKFTKITSNLNFGCNFKTKGKNICSKGGEREVCCCGDCGYDIGYLDLVPNNEETIKEIASLFNGKSNGFWRKGKGCILPTKYRSKTCITYRCEKAREHRDSTLPKFPTGREFLEQMTLYFLDASRLSQFTTTQARTIIKELIKKGGN